ncbi:MAG: hypothetical protein QOD10_3985, partial [Mycobacterium sp.]|nr:hypothetical protein [Mycobacterium sp.]
MLLLNTAEMDLKNSVDLTANFAGGLHGVLRE